jgi:hypothetical protein
MGQKVNPTSLRIGINQTWDSRWSHENSYSRFFVSDLAIRFFIEDLCLYQDLFLGKLYIWRACALDNTTVSFLKKEDNKGYVHIYFQLYVPYKLHALKVTWAQKQDWLSGIEKKIQSHLEEYFHNMYNVNVIADAIFEESSFDTKHSRGKAESLLNNDLIKWLLNKDSLMISQWIAKEFQKRKGLKELCKNIERCLDYIQESGKETKFVIRGIKISCSGMFKLTDNEKRRTKMARVKTFKKGQIPLQTLKRHVSYHMATAFTPDGTSGVKVWISYECL